MGLPNTRFYLDDGSGTFADDITSYVLLVEGLGLSRGRGDTDSGPTAGTLNIVVNNKSGAFTPGSTVLGSPSQIKVDQRIRVKETINGTTVTRFTGYVKSWALGWRSTTEASAVVRITATDAQARAERRVLRSVTHEEIMLDAPNRYYYPLDEADAATTAGDNSGNQSPVLIQAGAGTAVSFGGTLGTSAIPAAVFSNGKYLTDGLTNVGLVGGTTSWYFTIAFATTMSGSTGILIGSTSSGNTLAGIDSTGHLTCSAGAGITSSGVVNDGAQHVATVYATSTTTNLYLDGTLVGSAVQSAWLFPDGINIGQGFTGQLAHYASWFTTVPTVGDIAIQANATVNGFAGESGTARLTRLASYANITTGSFDTSLTNVPAANTVDQSAWQAIQDVADAEMGVAYIAGDGTLTFHNRQRVTMKTAPDLTLNGFVTTDAEPTTDDQDLLNYLETSSTVTGASQVARSTTSETTHGRYSDSRSYLVSTDSEALDRANWLVTTRAEPASSGRYGTLTVNLYGMTPAQQLAAVQALEHGCWLRVLNMPTQTTGGTTVDVVVEGIAENQSGDGWQIACNVVPKATLYPKVFILDSSVLDGPDLLGV